MLLFVLLSELEEGIMYALIIAVAVIVFYLLVLDRLNRIAYVTEVAAQYQESIDRKLSALVEQLVDSETK